MRLRVLFIVVVVALLATVAISILVSGCGDDGPTGPEQPKDYAFYFNDGANPHLYYRYRTSNGLVDTFTVPYRSYGGFAASADGRRLYLADNYSPLVAVISTDSFQTIMNLSYSGNRGIEVSPNNRLVAINGAILYLLNTSDYSIYYRDTLGSSGGRFSFDNHWYYCLAESGVTTIDLSGTFRRTTMVLSGGAIIEVAPSVDDKEWFLYRMYSDYLYSFAVYDVQRDSVVFEQSMPPGGGHIVVDPKGKYAYVSAPGSMLWQIAGPSGFLVYDIASNRILDTVETRQAANAYMTINGLAVTADGKWLAATEGLGGTAFVTCEVDSLIVRKYYDFGPQVSMSAVTCPNGL